MAFSHDGTQLGIIGGDQDHSIVFYATKTGQWGDASAVSHGVIGRGRVFCTTFVGKESYPFFVGMQDSAEFVRPAPCFGVTRKQGQFAGTRCPRVPLLCAVRAFNVSDSVDVPLIKLPLSDSDLDALVLTGTSSGALYLWQRLGVTKQIPGAHSGPVYALAVATYAGQYVSGGSDATIKLWDAQLQLLQAFHLADAPFSFLISAVTSLRFGGSHDSKILFEARSGELVEMATVTGNMVLLNEAHSRLKKCAAEAHGLDAHPNDGDIFATTGDDGTVRIWSVTKRRCILRAPPEVLGGAAARCCAWAPDGERIAIGLGGDPMDKSRDGSLAFLHVPLLDNSSEQITRVIVEVRKSKLPLVDIKWSEDGKVLAVGSEDGRVTFRVQYTRVVIICQLLPSCAGLRSRRPRCEFADDVFKSRFTYNIY